MAITRKPVASSNIRSVGFDAATGKGEIEFSNGRVYEYEGDGAADHFAKLMDPATSSIGSYFAKNVRGDKNIKSMLMENAAPITDKPIIEQKAADPQGGSGLQAPEPLKQLF
jgi:hypothetical protein